MTFYKGSAREIRGRAQSSSRNIWHEQPVRHALLEMPDHRGIETASASPLAVLKLDDSGVYVSTRKGKRVLLCSCPSFSNPVRLCLNSKKSPGFLRGRGFKLDKVSPLQSPVSPGTLHLVRAVSFYRSKFLDWCGPLTTYRRASCLSASTICRYITAIGPTIGEGGLNPGHIAGRIS